MIHLFYSSDPELARRSALKLLKKDFPVRDESNYVCLNMADAPLGQLVDEVMTPSFLSERKAVFAEDCAFLAKKEKKAPRQKAKKAGDMDKALSSLAAYCASPSETIDLYLVVYAADIDAESPVAKAIAVTGKVVPCPLPAPSSWVGFALNYLKKRGVACETMVANEIVKRVDGDYGRFLNELDKLASYANGEPLSLRAVQMLVAPALEDNAFEMSNALLSGNANAAFAVYRDLKVHGVDEVRLLNMLGTQFRFMEQCAYLDDRGLDASAIANALNVKPFRVQVTLRNLSSVDPSRLLAVQEDLYATEKAVLSGEVAPEYAFERFLANFALR